MERLGKNLMSKTVSLILPYYNRKELLKKTLDSFQYFYQNDPHLEIVIVDDYSNEECRVEDLIKKYDLNILLVRIQQKNGINPCYPYNLGVRQSKGNIIVLSSPETFHTTNMFKVSDNFEELSDKTYLQFSVFCLVKEMEEIDKKKFYENLGETGYPYANRYGSWYTHSKIQSSCLNFFSAITRSNYIRLSGFDERFRYGTGYDDEDFKLRVLNLINKVIWFDGAEAIHIDHEIVDNQPPTTNQDVFNKTRKDIYKFNSNWGSL